MLYKVVNVCTVMIFSIAIANMTGSTEVVGYVGGTTRGSSES